MSKHAWFNVFFLLGKCAQETAASAYVHVQTDSGDDDVDDDQHQTVSIHRFLVPIHTQVSICSIAITLIIQFFDQIMHI